RGGAVCSIAFVQVGDQIGVGWVGNAEIAVTLGQQPVDAHAVVVRDDEGREAHAWSADASREVEVWLMCRALQLEGEAPARIQAVWPGSRSEPAFASPPSQERLEILTSAEEGPGSAADPSTSGPGPSLGVSRWLERIAEERARAKSIVEDQ